MCHCIACQRRTGSAFSIAAFYNRDAVTVTDGVSKTFTRSSDVGKLVTFHFCPDCGTSLYWEPERMPHLIGVAVGAFGDPDFPQPEQAVFAETRHGWLGLPEDMSIFATLSPSAAGKA